VKTSYNLLIIIKIIIIIIIVAAVVVVVVVVVVVLITFMQRVYNYTPQTNHVSRVHNVAAFLLLPFMVYTQCYSRDKCFVLPH
jgi:flagellar basal body-associated protein FliL